MFSSDEAIEHNRELIRQFKAAKEAEEARRIFELLPQGPGSGLDADLLDGLHAEEIIEEAASRPVRVAGGGGGKGMEQHGNEYHEPDFATETALATHEADPNIHHTEAHTLDSHSEKKLDQVDEKTPAAGVTVDGCLIKDGKVADSNLLEASTKVQVQDHNPKAHTHGKADITDLDQVYVYTTLSFAVTGELSVDTDVAPTLPIPPGTYEIVKAKAYVKIAPTGASIIVDVNKDGTTIFTTQSKRPQIAIGEHLDDSDTPDVTTITEDDLMTIDIDQIGSETAGAGLTVEVVCKQYVSA